MDRWALPWIWKVACSLATLLLGAVQVLSPPRHTLCPTVEWFRGTDVQSSSASHLWNKAGPSRTTLRPLLPVPLDWQCFSWRINYCKTSGVTEVADSWSDSCHSFWYLFAITVYIAVQSTFLICIFHVLMLCLIVFPVLFCKQDKTFWKQAHWLNVQIHKRCML